MLLYNLTVIIDQSIHHEWLKWVQDEHIPSAMETNLFASSRLLKVLDSPNEGYTYCIQYVLDDISSYHEFQTKHEEELLSAHSSKFENKFVSFASVMEFVNTQ